jgi:hypothetical protein
MGDADGGPAFRPAAARQLKIKIDKKHKYNEQKED